MSDAGRPTFLHILLGALRGGCERDCEMVVQYLPDVGHRVLVLGPDGPMTKAWADAGATVDVLGPTPAWAVRRVVRDYARRHRPAAAVAWYGLPHLPQILAGLDSSGARVGVHGGNPAHTMPWWVDWRYVLLGAIHPLRRLPIYVCCSQHVAASFAHSRYLSRFPTQVVLNGVELPLTDSYRPRPFGLGDHFVIGMLGRLDKIKDHATVLRSFAILRRTCPEAELEFAGTGDEEANLRALARKLGVADAVRFLGSIGDIYGVLTGWDMFAYATTDAEGMGNAPAEALMLGLPSVMTDVGPMREVCGAGGAALLVPPFNPDALAGALARLAADHGLRDRLSEAGRRWAREQFHPAGFARHYGELLLSSRPDRDGGDG